MKRFKRFKRYLSTVLTLMMITTSLSFNPVLGAEVVDGTGGNIPQMLPEENGGILRSLKLWLNGPLVSLELIP